MQKLIKLSKFIHFFYKQFFHSILIFQQYSTQFQFTITPRAQHKSSIKTQFNMINDSRLHKSTIFSFFSVIFPHKYTDRWAWYRCKRMGMECVSNGNREVRVEPRDRYWTACTRENGKIHFYLYVKCKIVKWINIHFVCVCVCIVNIYIWKTTKIVTNNENKQNH